MTKKKKYCGSRGWSARLLKVCSPPPASDQSQNPRTCIFNVKNRVGGVFGTKQQHKAAQSLAQRNKILPLTRVKRAILLGIVYKDILFDVGLVVFARDRLGVYFRAKITTHHHSTYYTHSYIIA